MPILAAELRPPRARGGGQGAVAGFVTAGVVELLEVVEIEQRDRDVAQEAPVGRDERNADRRVRGRAELRRSRPWAAHPR
jgi:hypothetical protein